MNICFLNMPIEYYSPVSGGAIATIIMETTRWLTTYGHDVVVLSAETQDEQYDWGKVIPLRFKKRGDMGYVERRFAGLQNRIWRWDWPCYGAYRRAFLRAIAKLPTAPDVVVTFNDLVSARYIKRRLPNTKTYCWLQNECRTNQRDLGDTLACTDLFFTCSDYIAQWTQITHKLPADRFLTLHSGVDCVAFRPRANYLETQPLKVLFVGRIDRNKGPDMAVDAVKQLQDEGIPISIAVAGGLWFYSHGNEMADPFFRELRAKMDAAKADYLGHVTRDRIADLYRQYDVVCTLSRSNEPFGLVVLEAMASGCAVISSNRGGLPEACGDAAVLVDPDRIEDVVSALRAFATDPKHLATWKLKAVERAERAAWSQVAQNLIDACLRTQEKTGERSSRLARA